MLRTEIFSVKLQTSSKLSITPSTIAVRDIRTITNNQKTSYGSQSQTIGMIRMIKKTLNYPRMHWTICWIQEFLVMIVHFSLLQVIATTIYRDRPDRFDRSKMLFETTGAIGYVNRHCGTNESGLLSKDTS